MIDLKRSLIPAQVRPLSRFRLIGLTSRPAGRSIELFEGSIAEVQQRSVSQRVLR